PRSWIAGVSGTSGDAYTRSPVAADASASTPRAVPLAGAISAPGGRVVPPAFSCPVARNIGTPAFSSAVITLPSPYDSGLSTYAPAAPGALGIGGAVGLMELTALVCAENGSSTGSTVTPISRPRLSVVSLYGMISGQPSEHLRAESGYSSIRSNWSTH